MIYKEISIYTMIPDLCKIVNSNNASIERYIGLFYDGSTATVKTPVTTSGTIKGAKGEFVSVVTDNLIVKRQFTNMYENVTTSNLDWYNTFKSGVTLYRDPSTYENAGYDYIDVNKAYYKVYADSSVALRCNNLSQVVELIIDASGSGQFNLLLDPSGSTYTVTGTISPGENVTLINVAYDASYGSSWVVMSSNGSGTKTLNIIP
jgi:hypothetical protein